MSSAILSIHESIPEILKHAQEKDREEIEQCFDPCLTAAEILALKEELPPSITGYCQHETDILSLL